MLTQVRGAGSSHWSAPSWWALLLVVQHHGATSGAAGTWGTTVPLLLTRPAAASSQPLGPAALLIIHSHRSPSCPPPAGPSWPGPALPGTAQLMKTSAPQPRHSCLQDLIFWRCPSKFYLGNQLVMRFRPNWKWNIYGRGNKGQWEKKGWRWCQYLHCMRFQMTTIKRALMTFSEIVIISAVNLWPGSVTNREFEHNVSCAPLCDTMLYACSTGSICNTIFNLTNVPFAPYKFLLL